MEAFSAVKLRRRTLIINRRWEGDIGYASSSVDEYIQHASTALG